MRNIFEYYKEDDYLAHYGVDGQKWGVRNGPPYPLNRSSKDSDSSLSNSQKVIYGKKLVDNNEKAGKAYGHAYLNPNKKVIKKSDRDAIFKQTLERNKLRNELYKSSKKCKDILDKVRSIREKYMPKNNIHDFDDKEFKKNFDELNNLSIEFRKAAKEIFVDVLKASGNEKVKYWHSKYLLSDVLSDQAGYDDFWDYVYGTRV